MQYYELVGLIPGNLAENEVEPILQEISDIIKNSGAEIKRQELIGRRKTAYAIQKMRHAYYFIIGFEHDSGLKEAEKKLKLHKNLLRYLITKTKPKTAEDIAKEKKRMQKQEETTEIKTEKAPIKIKQVKSTEDTEKTKEEIEKKPVDLEQLDKKIDEILQEEIK